MLGAGFRVNGAAPVPRAPAPRLGADTEAVLAELGYPPEEIAALRALFRTELKQPLAWLIGQIKKGELTLVVNVESADIMASLVEFKKDFAEQDGDSIKLTFAGASEAHLLAKEIGEAGIGVLLTRPRPFPTVWEQRRM